VRIERGLDGRLERSATDIGFAEIACPRKFTAFSLGHVEGYYPT
jgi:hypothetical protein